MELCRYEATKEYIDFVCSRFPEICLLYRWCEEGMNIDVLFPENKLEQKVKE